MKKQTLQKASRGILLPLCLALCLLLSACSLPTAEPPFDFYALERQDYENENGYSMQFPADWQLLSEDAENSTFISGDGSLSCTIGFELGGVEVYSLEEVGDMLLERLGDSLFSSWESEHPRLDSTTYRNRVLGLREDGEALSLDLNVYHVQEGVRYYMSFLCETKVYEAKLPLINAIMESFETTKRGDVLYEMMMQRREEQAQAEWEAAMEELEAEQAQDTETPEGKAPDSEQGQEEKE